jgi:hypothetical protein
MNEQNPGGEAFPRGNEGWFRPRPNEQGFPEQVQPGYDETAVMPPVLPQVVPDEADVRWHTAPMLPVTTPAYGSRPVMQRAGLNDDVYEDDDEADSFIRPFIVTGGRTSPLQDNLRIETLVRSLPAALSAPLAFERRTVVELCQRPHSVAEVAARLGVPLGVAKVVIGDLIADNLMFCHESAEGGQMSVSTIERIRDLVRAL